MIKTYYICIVNQKYDTNMIYRIFIIVLIFCVILYYLFCFLEIFGVIKFTEGKNSGVKFPKMLIPFYYLFTDK